MGIDRKSEIRFNAILCSNFAEFSTSVIFKHDAVTPVTQSTAIVAAKPAQMVDRELSVWPWVVRTSAFILIFVGALKRRA